MSDLLQRAYSLHRSGRRTEAAELYRQVLAEEPEQPDALQLLGLVHMQQGQPVQAAALIERALVARPDSAPFYANLAEIYRKLGRLDEAAEAARKSLQFLPDFPAALTNLGIILVAQGKYAEALEPLQRAAANLPGLAKVWHVRAAALIALGRAAEALPHCDTALRLEPDKAIFHHNRGNCLQALGRLDEAQEAYLKALESDKQLNRLSANLGYVLHDMGLPDRSLTRLRQAVTEEPDNAAFWEALAELHTERDEFDEAVPCWERVLALVPGRARTHRLLGVALQELNRLDEAKEHFEQAVALAPDSGAAQFDLASYYEIIGDFDRAETAFRTALRLQPDNPLPLGRLANLRRGQLPDADFALLEQTLAHRNLGEHARIQLLLGRSHVLDARGEYAEAAQCQRQANALVKARNEVKGRGYLPTAHELFTNGVRAVFTPELFARLAGSGLPTRRPVFVFGLPRSGTTLVEQVLASHPAVFGAGELQLVARTVAGIPKALQRPGPPLVCIDGLTPEAIRQLAEGHLAALEKLDGGKAARVVDKMPHNYLFLGVLALLFPNATLIHCRRDLRDVAVSCWSVGFRNLDWSYDMGDIASRFTQYVRLMQHWRAVLPAPVHAVVYEDFVHDLEGGARRLLDAVGLDWDPACLEFYRTERPIHTASFSQVRQPVYTKSVGRWKHYERELADLFALLPTE